MEAAPHQPILSKSRFNGDWVSNQLEGSTVLDVIHNQVLSVCCAYLFTVQGY